MEKYVNERKYHYLYKITNLVNNKYYYGIHSTDNLEELGIVEKTGVIKIKTNSPTMPFGERTLYNVNIY